MDMLSSRTLDWHTSWLPHYHLTSCICLELIFSISYILFLEKEMATHSSILAWKIPWMVELSRWQSVGSQRVGHNWATSRHFTSSAFSKTSLNIRKFVVHVLVKPGLANFEHYFTSIWDECNCAIVWAFLCIAFLWNWDENWPFPVLWPLLTFLNLLAYWVQHFHSIIFQDLKQLNWNSITSTSFFS